MKKYLSLYKITCQIFQTFQQVLEHPSFVVPHTQCCQTMDRYHQVV